MSGGTGRGVGRGGDCRGRFLELRTEDFARGEALLSKRQFFFRLRELRERQVGFETRHFQDALFDLHPGNDASATLPFAGGGVLLRAVEQNSQMLWFRFGFNDGPREWRQPRAILDQERRLNLERFAFVRLRQFFLGEGNGGCGTQSHAGEREKSHHWNETSTISCNETSVTTHVEVRGALRKRRYLAVPLSSPDRTAADSDREQKQEEADPSPPQLRRAQVSALLTRPFDVRSIALTGLFILAVFYTVYFMRSVLLPMVLALTLSYLLRPIVRAMARVRIPTQLGAAIILLTLIAGIGYAISFLAVPAAGWLQKAPYSMQQLQQKLLPLRQPIQRVAQASGQIEQMTAPADGEAKPAVEVKQHPLTETLFVRTPEFIMSTVVILILLYFLLAYDGVFLAKIIKLTPRLADKKRSVSIANDIASHVSRFLLTQTLINICLGAAVGTAVGALGLRNPIMWGVMVAVFNFVPYLGALTGIVCMTLGAVLSYDSLSYAMVFPAVYLTLATIEGNFITPMVMGRSLTLNPVLILVSLTFWGWMWGIAGIILAVPILAAFKIFCEHIEPMQPIAEFLS